MGSEADLIFAHFQFATDDERNNYNVVIEKFDDHFVPSRNVIHERAKFHKRQQRQGETIEQYVRCLYELSEYADFKEREETIRDRLVLGMIDQELSEKLQLQANLTLQDTIKTARQHEQVKEELEQQRTLNKGTIDRVKAGFRNRFNTKPRPRIENRREDSRQTFRPIDHCGKCGRTHDKGKCPAQGKKCLKCNKLNHFASVCRTKTKQFKNKTENVNEIESVEDEHFFIGSTETNNGKQSPWRVDLFIEGTEINWKIDTGADVNVISKTTWQRIGEPQLSSCKGVTLQSPGGQVKTLGRFQTCFDKNFQTTIYVIDNPTDNLLSRSTASRMNLVKRIDSTDFSVVKCQPIKIKLREGVQPYSVSVARRVPIPLLDKVEKELQRMKDCGIIEEITEPTEWVSPMVPVLKPNGDVRICIDLKKLNQAVQRERYVIPTVDDIIHKLRGSSVFSKLDALSGFWQLPLDPETAKRTTFITPFGRFFMKRLPFGISSAPEIFQRTMNELLGDTKGVICYFDDILIHSADEKEHNEVLLKVKTKLKEVGLTLNEDKCLYKQSEIKFLGHIINNQGIKPDPAKISAITDLREPSDITELRRYLGMVNFLGKFIPHLSTTLKPINKLLEKETTWTWDKEQQTAFNKVKACLTTAPTLAYFDPSRPTIVEADSSSYGLGGVLLQEKDGHLFPVAFCSRSLSASEQRYAQIEKECLAAVYACERFERYLVGLGTYHLYTDHKPLVPLINSKDLSDTPIRCQRMLMRLMRFHPVAVYKPGKTMLTSDTLSRSPSKETDNSVQEDIALHLNSVKESWPISDAKLNQIQADSMKDISLRIAMEYTLDGWPTYLEDVKLAARNLFQVRNELSVVNGILLRGNRIVIPFSLQEEMLNRIHDGHLGVVKCRERAKQGVWWPGISKDIKKRISSCRQCLEKLPSQPKEPLLNTTLPERPFQQVAADLFEFKNKHYLVYVDYYSRWIEISLLNNQLSSSSVINKMKSCFASSGIPEKIITDNGPQFSSAEFKKFSEEWNFSHVTSSPHYPKSNGEAERAVKTAKSILRQDDPPLALLAYRSTPITSLGFSPAELACGRRLRTTLPVPPQTLMPYAVNPETVRKRDERQKDATKAYYDLGAQQLPQLYPGDPVLIKEDGRSGWKRQGKIVQQCAPRSYILQTAEGELRRNRRHLRLNTADGQELKSSSNDSRRSLLLDPAVPNPGAPTSPSTESANDLDHPAPVAYQQPPIPVLPQPSGNTGSTPNGSPYTTRSGRKVIKPARFHDG